MNLKDYFSFTRGEKRGVVFFLSIILLLIISIPFTDYLKENRQTDFSEFEAAINKFEKERYNQENTTKEHVEIQLFEFNPNIINNNEWKQLGFKDWQIKTINNYKSKGGSWKTKDDVSKIYGLSPEYYQQLKPYILLPKEVIQKGKIKINYFYFNPNTITKSE